MELRDVPGQLTKAIEPVARLGGNIQGIMHQRERKTPLGRIPVMLVFEIKDKKTLEKLLAELKKNGIAVTQIGESIRGVKRTTILIGHIIHTDIRDTIDRLNGIPGVRVSDMSLAMSELGKDSSARMTITADSEGSSNLAIKKLRQISEQKDLLLITSLEGEE